MSLEKITLGAENENGKLSISVSVSLFSLQHSSIKCPSQSICWLSVSCLPICPSALLLAVWTKPDLSSFSVLFLYRHEVILIAIRWPVL